MYKYLFIIEIYPDDYIDIDRYALALDLNPNVNWALESEAQAKVEENKSLFEKLRKDYVAKHWGDYREYAIENKFFNDTLINDFIKTVSVYATLVNPNDNEMIDTYNNLPQIEV
jgi:hypothetical protein